MLSLVEGFLSHRNAAEGSFTIATISFVLAISLFVLFQRIQYSHPSNERKV
jgi:hypothetical protein